MLFKQKVLPLYKIMKAKHLNTTITPHRSLISFGINGVCKVIRRKTFLFELFDVYYLAFPNNWLTHRLTASQLAYLDTRNVRVWKHRQERNFTEFPLLLSSYPPAKRTKLA